MNECRDLLTAILHEGFRELPHKCGERCPVFNYEGMDVKGDAFTAKISEDEYCEGVISGDWEFKHCAREGGNTLTSIKRRFVTNDAYYEVSMDNNCTVELTQSGSPLIGELLVNGRYELSSVYRNDQDTPISELIFDPLFKRFEGRFEDIEALKVLKEGLRWMFNRDKSKNEMHGIGIYVPTWEFMGFDVCLTEIGEL